jgi:hypothetical protein
MIGNGRPQSAFQQCESGLVFPSRDEGLLKRSPKQSLLSRSTMTLLQLGSQLPFFRAMQPVRYEENPDKFLDSYSSLVR